MRGAVQKLSNMQNCQYPWWAREWRSMYHLLTLCYHIISPRLVIESAQILLGHVAAGNGMSLGEQGGRFTNGLAPRPSLTDWETPQIQIQITIQIQIQIQIQICRFTNSLAPRLTLTDWEKPHLVIFISSFSVTIVTMKNQNVASSRPCDACTMHCSEQLWCWQR